MHLVAADVQVRVWKHLRDFGEQIADGIVHTFVSRVQATRMHAEPAGGFRLAGAPFRTGG